MAEVTAYASVWHPRAGEMRLRQNEKAPQLFRLELCMDVQVVLDRGAADVAEQAAAMRELARLATEAAEDLERRMTEPGEDNSDD